MPRANENHRRVKGRQPTGAFVMLQKRVLRSAQFRNLSGKAIKLLLAFMEQYHGSNNGNLYMTWNLMAQWFGSKQTLHAAKRELVAKGWIMLSRQGGKNLASMYALTQFPIDECKVEHDLSPTTAAPNTWRPKN